MTEQSVKLSRLIIFYFIGNFLLYAPILPNQEPKNSAFRSVFVVEQFFSSSIVVSVAKANVLQSQTIAVFARKWSTADPIQILRHLDGAFDWLSASMPFFCTVLPKNCISLSQSQTIIFFMYIIND